MPEWLAAFLIALVTGTLVEYWGLFKGLPKPDKDAVFTGKFRPVIDAWLKKIKK